VESSLTLLTKRGPADGGRCGGKTLKLRDRFGADQREPIASGGRRLRKGNDSYHELIDDGSYRPDRDCSRSPAIPAGSSFHWLPLKVAEDHGSFLSRGRMLLWTSQWQNK
jgi:hypothetical protein